MLDTDPQVTYPDGSELDSIRSKLNRVSIPDLAKRSGVSPGMLRDIRRGDRRPSAKTLEAIAEALARALEES